MGLFDDLPENKTFQSAYTEMRKATGTENKKTIVQMVNESIDSIKKQTIVFGSITAYNINGRNYFNKAGLLTDEFIEAFAEGKTNSMSEYSCSQMMDLQFNKLKKYELSTLKPRFKSKFIAELKQKEIDINNNTINTISVWEEEDCLKYLDEEDADGRTIFELKIECHIYLNKFANRYEYRSMHNEWIK